MIQLASTHKNSVARTIIMRFDLSVHFLFSLRCPTTLSQIGQMMVYKVIPCFLGPLFTAKLL